MKKGFIILSVLVCIILLREVFVMGKYESSVAPVVVTVSKEVDQIEDPEPIDMTPVPALKPAAIEKKVEVEPPQQALSVEPSIQPAQEPLVAPQPAIEPQVDKDREDFLRQIRDDTLVTCQTKIMNCEPRQMDQKFATPDQITFCVTYAEYCENTESIGRIFTPEEVFPVIPEGQQNIDFSNQQDINYPTNPNYNENYPVDSLPNENHSNDGFDY